MSRRETILSCIALVVIGVAARLLPHLPNFAPVTATALFCGAFMPRRISIAAPLAIMLLSDYALLYVNPYGRVDFSHVYTPVALWHSTLPYIYASFGISALAGWLLRRRRTPVLVVGAAVFCSLQFFLITNAAVWLEGAYARGLDGLWQSYVMGLPFLRGTVEGDLVYTAAFFGLWELSRRLWTEPGRRRQNALASA
jgi:hypothetical protein